MDTYVRKNIYHVMFQPIHFVLQDSRLCPKSLNLPVVAGCKTCSGPPRRRHNFPLPATQGQAGLAAQRSASLGLWPILLRRRPTACAVPVAVPIHGHGSMTMAMPIGNGRLT